METIADAATSDAFEWWKQPEEVFHFLGVRFDVRHAKRTIAGNPRPVVDLTVADLRGLVGLIGGAQREKTTIDLAFPCIVARMPEEIGGGHMLMDGWHRARVAIAQGVETLPAVVLTVEETIAASSDLAEIVKRNRREARR